MKEKKEYPYVINFLECLHDSKFSCISIPEAHEKRPDFYIPELKMLIELKEIHDQVAVENLARWSSAVSKISEFVHKHPDVEKVRGLYSINTPSLFKYPRDNIKVKEAANTIIGAVLKGEKEVSILRVKFKIKKISDKENGVYFGATGGCGSVNPASTIYQNIFNKIIIANKQLSYKGKDTIQKRILLLVNKYPLGCLIDEVIKGLGLGYEELIKLKNIDEVWVQYSLKTGASVHNLIYTKEFFEKYESNNLYKDQRHYELFQRWFFTLVAKGSSHKEKLWRGLKVFLQHEEPESIFKDKFKRQEMVRLGEWLLEEKKFKEAIWVIEKFINDSDPPDPNKYVGDLEFNYHLKIKSGGDPFVITTVLGALAWVIQKLSLQKNYISQSLHYTEVLIKHSNYYVKSQAIVPLIEISIRRKWLDGYGSRPYKSDYKKFHDIVFYLVGLIEKEPNLTAIISKLILVFDSYTDLSVKEVDRILFALQNTTEAARLFVHFGIYHREYQGLNKTINNKKIERILVERIKSTDDVSERFHSEFIWIFQDILEKKPEDFDMLKKYLDMLFKRPFRKDLYNNFLEFIFKWIEKKPEECSHWFEEILKNIMKHAKNKQKIDVWFYYIEEILTFFSKRDPQKLVKYMRNFVKLWNKGGFIGDVRVIFALYENISNKKQQNEAREIFKKLYYSMKKINPRLKDVNWR